MIGRAGTVRVWVTRDEPIDGPMGRAVRDAGLTPVHEPVLERRIVGDARAAVAALGPDDWLVLTSPFAVDAIAANTADAARRPRLAVVGAATRAAAVTCGFEVRLVGSGPGAETLFAELAPHATGHTVCYPRSSRATPPTLPAGIRLVSPVLYETTDRPYRRAVVDEIDVVAVASPSAVRAVGVVARPFASIGTTTTAALRAIGVEPWVVAPTPGFDTLARVIADAVRGPA